MKRLFIASAVAALLAYAAATPWSASAQTGGGGASGGTSGSGATSGAGAGTAGASGTSGTASGTSGTSGAPGSGTTGQTGAAGTAGTNAGTARTGTGVNAPGQAQLGTRQTQTGAILNAQGQIGTSVPATTNQAPFFSNTTVQQELGLNRTQIDQLNRAHQSALNRFNQGVNGLDANLTPEQRAMRIQQLQTAFNTDFSGNLNTAFSDPAMQQRFNQLNLQSQGFGAFQNPTVQRQLNLTPDQRRQFAQLAAQWRQQLNDLRTAARGNLSPAQQQFSDLQMRLWDQANNILNPQQQQAWAQLIGQRFNFPPDVFIPQMNARGTIGLQNTTGQRSQIQGSAATRVPQAGATQTQRGTVR